MMIKRSEQQQAADSVTQAYEDLETQILQNIIRHVKNYGQLIDSDEWLMQKLAEIGKLNQENIRIIAKAAGLHSKAVEDMCRQVANLVLSRVEPGISELERAGVVEGAVPVEKSKNVQKAVDTVFKQAQDALNKCNTNMLYMAQDAYQQLVQGIVDKAQEISRRQEFLDILGQHATAEAIGSESRGQAIRSVLREFNERGIPAFVDRAGRKWTPEAYVSMTLRSTSVNVATEAMFARMEDRDMHLIQVSSHTGARPKCAKDQGKVFDLRNGSGEVTAGNGRKIRYYPWSSSSYGEPDGLFGINCGHHGIPFLPGISNQRYFPTEDFEENDKLYRKMQAQRSLERDVRKQKRLCSLYDEIGDRESFERAAVTLKDREARLVAYTKKNGLTRRRDREQVYGFDRQVSAEAVAAHKVHKTNRTGTVDESKISQKNQKAAENWAKKHLGVKKTNYAKQSVQVVNQTNRALQRIYRENPVLKGFIDEIEFRDIPSVAQASLKIRKGVITTKLTFSQSKCTDEKSIQRMIDQQVKDGFWAPKKGLYGIVKHEATHLSEYALILKRYNVDRSSGVGDITGAIQAIKNHEISSEIQRKALKNCNYPLDYDTIKTRLCEYAAREGAGEFLAEACSEYRPRKLAKEVQKLFKEEMMK